MEEGRAGVGAARTDRGVVRQGLAGTLLAVVNGILAGVRFCSGEFDSVFWGACVLIVVGITLSARSMLKGDGSGSLR